MTFNPYATLETLAPETRPPAKTAKPAKQTAGKRTKVMPFSNLASLAPSCVPNPKSKPVPDVSPYGQTASGRQRTWTGKVVSLDDWRNLSEWERHGSTGKVWNGLARAWEDET